MAYRYAEARAEESRYRNCATMRHRQGNPCAVGKQAEHRRELSDIRVRTAIVIGDHDTAISRANIQGAPPAGLSAPTSIIYPMPDMVPVENPRARLIQLLRFIDGKNADQN